MYTPYIYTNLIIMKKICLTIMVLSMLGIISCNEEEGPAYSPVGFWKGKYSLSPAVAPYIASNFFLFRTDGTMREFYGADTTTLNKTEGTYTVSGNTVNWTADYSGSLLEYSAVFTSDGDSLIGTYGSSPSNSDGGRIAAGRQ